jgi:hypothetical protein
MRRLKQISLAVVLMFTLATGAMAGITECPPEPPPPPSAPATEATENTDTPLLSAQTPNDATDPVIEFAFSVLRSVLLAF